MPPLRIIGILLAGVFAASAAYSQIWSGGDMWNGWRGEPPRYATRAIKDGRFHFCRLMYPSAWREAGGQGWRTDYPGADINFSIRFAELTKTAVGIDGRAIPSTSSSAAAVPKISSAARTSTSKTREPRVSASKTSSSCARTW